MEHKNFKKQPQKTSTSDPSWANKYPSHFLHHRRNVVIVKEKDQESLMRLACEQNILSQLFAPPSPITPHKKAKDSNDVCPLPQPHT